MPAFDTEEPADVEIPQPPQPEASQRLVEAPGPPGDGLAYEDLFRRYRDSALATLHGRWQKPQITDDSDDAGKLRQICLGYQQIRPLDIQTLRLGNRRVPDNVLVKTAEAHRCIAFLHAVNSNSIHARLSNLNQLVLRHRQVQFFLMRDAFASPIRSRAASQALAAFLNGSGDGRRRTFERPLDLERRVALEFVHQLVSDILNRELDLPLRDALDLLASHDPDNWVVKLLHPQRAA